MSLVFLPQIPPFYNVVLSSTTIIFCYFRLLFLSNYKNNTYEHNRIHTHHVTIRISTKYHSRLKSNDSSLRNLDSIYFIFFIIFFYFFLTRILQMLTCGDRDIQHSYNKNIHTIYLEYTNIYAIIIIIII